jgi:hypothetical protein
MVGDAFGFDQYHVKVDLGLENETCDGKRVLLAVARRCTSTARAAGQEAVLLGELSVSTARKTVQCYR